MVVLIILLTIYAIGCQSYNIRPTIVATNDLYNTISVESTLHYKINASYYAGFEKELLIQSIQRLPFATIREETDDLPSSPLLVIVVDYISPRNGGIVYISALTLGIIPTCGKSEFRFQYKLLFNNNTIHEKEYIMQRKTFNWIFAAPGAFGNRGREQKTIDQMTRDFFNEIDFSNLERKVPAASP
jgi:hypothetical protein